jgi:hypothetical protein
VDYFSFFLIQFVPRSTNNSAHLCAKLACTLTVTSSWLDCILDFLKISIIAHSASSLNSPQKKREPFVFYILLEHIVSSSISFH